MFGKLRVSYLTSIGFLALLLAFTLVACAGKSSSNINDTTTGQQGTTQTTSVSGQATSAGQQTGTPNATDDANQVKNMDQQAQDAIDSMNSSDQTATAAQSQTDGNQVP